MSYNLSNTDLRRAATVEKFLTNANEQLRTKSLEEQQEIFKQQEEIIEWISDSEFKESILKQFKELKNNALVSKTKFDSVIHNLENCKKLLDWKSLDEIQAFFDEIDTDISFIPDQKVRQLLIQQAQYWRDNIVQKTEVENIEKRLDEIENNHSLAWSTESEITKFFNELDSNISKMSAGEEYKSPLLFSSKILKDQILMDLKFSKYNFDISFMK